MTEWNRAPSAGQLRSDLMARLAATENEAHDLRLRNIRLQTQLEMTQQQLDMTRERLHEAIIKLGQLEGDQK